MTETRLRGYFAIGVEGLSKAHNAGALTRTAHAFGASFFFTLGNAPARHELNAVDTSAAGDHLPFFHYDAAEDLKLPDDCTLVGVELAEGAVDLPSFRHPLRAAYVLGPEKGSLSPALQARCAHLVKIPMRFCVNVGLAGAIVMYDRMLCLGKFAERPVKPGAVIDGKKRRSGRS